MSEYVIIIIADIFVVLFGYVAIGEIAKKEMETVRRCEDAEPIIEQRRTRRTILCVVGMAVVLCMLKAIIIA